MNLTPTTRWVVLGSALLALIVVGAWAIKGSPKEDLISAVALISGGKQASTTSEAVHYHYIEVTNGCGPYYDTGTCVNMRSGPGTNYPVIGRLRTGVVLKVEDTTIQKDRAWYKIIFDGEIRYPERVKGNWYVAVDPTSVQPLENVGDEDLTKETASTTKRIVVDMSEEKLYAYDGDVLFMEESISTGHDATPTPAGTFTVFRKTPSRYMQGPIPEVSDQYYDLPGVPWNLYFTAGGAVIHGAYWHDHFGEEWSHGCVNLPPAQAKKLYLWADLGTSVTVRR
ncbi:L,D-transpeptidase family protein [Candidatus Parcubacteria bacterium]|nr:L,D-transpeptidase family protein [Candidatus Parcubacteria bacterium]